MANSDKDILITPNIGQAALPEIKFVGTGNSPRYIRVNDDNSLAFLNNSGTERFSINEDLVRTSLSASGNYRVRNSSGTTLFNVTNSTNAIEIGGAGTGIAMVGGTTTATSPKLAIVQASAGSRYSLQIQTTGGIADGQYDGIGFVQGAAGATPLGGIRCEFRNSGSPDFGWYTRSGGSTESIKLKLWNSGNLSIGTADQTEYTRLSVLGGSGITIRPDTSSANNRHIYFRQAANNNGFVINQDDASVGMLFFRAINNGSETNPLLTLDRPNQRVGVGNFSTSSRPGFTLDVNGDINTTGQFRRNGVIFNPLPAQSASTIGAALRSDGTNAFWDIGGGGSGGGTSALPYAAEDRYRVGFQITRGYAMAGYKDSTSYKNVCSINHANNTLTNHGDLLTNGQGYCAGAQNLSMFAYVMIAVNGVGGTGSTCSKINMNTNANAGTTSINNNRSATSIMRRDFRYAYVYGGGDSRPDRFNLSNDTSALAPNGNPSGDENNPAGGYGATYGWSKKNGGYAYSWANETYAAWPNNPGTDGSNKTMNARHGYNYWNTGGGYRTSANFSKRSSFTGSEATQVGKFECGEETFHTGMNRGYMCGMYDGAQKNTGAVLNYAAETFTADANINRVGPPGSASGAGAEFGTVLAGYDGV
jgi:hypothetical protein